MKKILLVYATAGAGHIKACFAVRDALKSKEIPCEIVDILDYTNVFLKWLYQRFYIVLVQYVPTLWAIIYYSLDMPWVYSCVKNLRTFINKLNAGRFTAYFIKTKPDVVVSTHFFSSEVISTLKRKNIINTHLISVITDFKLHTYWVSKEVDLFVVANDELGRELSDAGIDKRNIVAEGVPIEPKFYAPLNKNILCEKLNIKKDLFTILIGSGGFGVGPVERIIKELISVGLPIQLLVVCGKSRWLYEDMQRLQKSSSVAMKIYGFVDNMHELMEVADLLISKSGGMTSSEAIAKELPMIVVSPVPGQEMRNSDFMVAKGAAIREDNPAAIKEKVIGLFNNKEPLDAMREKIRTLKRPNPALDVANYIAEL